MTTKIIYAYMYPQRKGNRMLSVTEEIIDKMYRECLAKTKASYGNMSVEQFISIAGKIIEKDKSHTSVYEARTDLKTALEILEFKGDCEICPNIIKSAINKLDSI